MTVVKEIKFYLRVMFFGQCFNEYNSNLMVDPKASDHEQ